MAIAINQYGSISSGSTNVSSLVQSSGSAQKSTYSEDVVNISQEAQELVAELRAKKAKTFITTDMEASFAKVASALPNSEGFNDMLNWLMTWSKADSGAISTSPKVEVDRNAYAKDPKKYTQLWENLYENYNSMMKTLGLNPQFAAHRQALNDSTIIRQVRARFTTDMDKDTKALLKFFNIYDV